MLGADQGTARDLTERVLACVEQIPVGSVMTYGDVAEFIGTRAARNVGRVLAANGGAVAWHRVLRADGSCAEHIWAEQLRLLRAEGVPTRGDRVDLARARWDGRVGLAGPCGGGSSAASS